MPKATTHFEQIPVEEVKKIAEEEVSGEKRPKMTKLIVETPTKKTERNSIRTHSL
jgi:hypothetical protein